MTLLGLTRLIHGDIKIGIKKLDKHADWLAEWNVAQKCRTFFAGFCLYAHWSLHSIKLLCYVMMQLPCAMHYGSTSLLGCVADSSRVTYGFTVRVYKNLR